MFFAERNEPYAFPVDRYKVIDVVGEKSNNLRFPELEALMPEDHSFLDSGILIHRGYIEDHNVVGVYVNGFITNHELLHTVDWISEHMDVGVTNVQLILVLDVELGLVWILFLDCENEKSKQSL